MEMKTMPNPVSPIIFVGFVGFLIFLRVLNWVIRIPEFYSSFQSLLQLFHLGLVFGVKSNAQSERKTPNLEHLNKQLSFHGKVDDGKLCRAEVEMVMEKLGISCDRDGDKLQEKLGSDEILDLFEEKDPTSEEMKEAFEVFDENRDGYIDAEELQRVLCTLGFVEGSEFRDCKRMIGAFDTNGDGRIDFAEFVKFMEISFC